MQGPSARVATRPALPGESGAGGRRTERLLKRKTPPATGRAAPAVFHSRRATGERDRQRETELDYAALSDFISPEATSIGTLFGTEASFTGKVMCSTPFSYRALIFSVSAPSGSATARSKRP